MNERELHRRIAAAITSCRALAGGTDDLVENVRLIGKSDGLSVALGYVEEYIRFKERHGSS